MSLRQHPLSKLCALTFVILIVLPFTAPFPTYDLGDPSGDNPYNDPLKEIKDKVSSDDELVIFSHWFLLPSALKTIVVFNLSCPSQLEEYPALYTILRL